MAYGGADQPESAFALPLRVALALLEDSGDHIDTLAGVCELVTEQVGDGCAILLATAGQLEPVAISHRRTDVRQVLSELLAGGSSSNGWLAARPFTTQDVLYLPTVPRAVVDGRDQDTVLPADAVNSVVVAPLWENDKVIGTLWVSRDGQAAAFRPDEVSTLETLGWLLGAAVARARRLRDLRERLATTEAEFEELDRRLGRTTATAEQLSRLVTQRLRGPVAALVGLVDLLASHDLDDATRIAVTTRLRERADEASRLLWNLIESSRTTASDGEEPESSDVEDVADWVARLLAPRMQVVGAEMDVRASGVIPLPPRMTRDLLLAMADATLQRATPGAHIQLLGDVSANGWRLAILHRDDTELPDPRTDDAWLECRRLTADLAVSLTSRAVASGGWMVVLEPA